MQAIILLMLDSLKLLMDDYTPLDVISERWIKQSSIMICMIMHYMLCWLLGSSGDVISRKLTIRF